MESQFFNLTAVEDPYPLYARLRMAGPAVQLGPGIFAVPRYEDALNVLKNTAVFSSTIMGGAGFGARTIIGTDPPDHTRLRNIVNKAFTPRMVAAMEPRIREISSGLIDDIVARGGDFDLIEDLAIPLPVIIIAEILGIDPDRREDFKRWSDAFVFPRIGSDESANSFEESRIQFREYFSAVIEARRAEPREDLISTLVRAEGEDTLTPEEVFAFTVLLLIAGNETTTNLIGNAVLALIDHQNQLARVQADAALVPNLVEEALRWDSPVQVIMRLATRDAEIGGVKVPAGSMVMPMFASANRDERQFADADQFDVTRANARDHLAFGYGPHFCLGAPLARLEAVVALGDILERLPGLQRRQENVERLGSFLLRGPRRLPLRFDAERAPRPAAVPA
jgi:cytochrome P450